MFLAPLQASNINRSLLTLGTVIRALGADPTVSTRPPHLLLCTCVCMLLTSPRGLGCIFR